MARTTGRTNNNGAATPTTAPKALSDTQRWAYGLALLFLAVYLLLSVVSYFFTWTADQSAIFDGILWKSETVEAENLLGKAGAYVGDFIAGKWFGVFGIGIPVMLLILSLRIIQYDKLLLRKSVRLTLIIMILGSVTLGLVFGPAWGIFGTSLGGAQGMFVAKWLTSYLGIGAGMVLILCWILLAVYINRNTIGVVNRVGRGIRDGGVMVGHAAGKVVTSAASAVAGTFEGNPAQPGAAQPGGTQPSAQPTPAPPAEAPQSPDQPAEVPPFRPDDDFEINIEREDSGMIVMAGDEPQQPDETLPGADGDALEVINPDPAEEFGWPGMAGGLGENPDNPEGQSLGLGAVVDGGEDGVDVLKALNEDATLDEDQIDPTVYDPTLELSHYSLPPVNILQEYESDAHVAEEELYANLSKIKETLSNFGIAIQGKIRATVGPTVTLYEMVPAPGVKISKIRNLEDDIALSLSALGIRIIAPIPGKGTIGIEVPNKDKKVVSMSSVLKSQAFQESNYDLPIVLGKTIQNETYVVDLAKMPHLLVAGATGQGKSVGLNAIIASLLYKKHPAELKLVLVDPKKVELTLYQKLEKHFLARIPGDDDAIITDTHKVIYTLNSLCIEMDERYTLLRKAEVRHIREYNEKFTNRRLNPHKGHRYLPYIVVIIDEFADMIMTAGREIETPIARLAQLARAVGIHLVIATQRPTTNIITGVIKANFPARIAFRVTSMIDSRTIIDQPGANQLIGKGDMLVSTGSELVRVQCAFIDTPDVERITDFIFRQQGYPDAYELPEYVPEGDQGSAKNTDMGKLDPMFEEVARFVVQNRQGSTSSIQRRFEVGYNRAGRIMDQIEAAGIVGRAEGSKPREVLINDMMTLESLLAGMGI